MKNETDDSNTPAILQQRLEKLRRARSTDYIADREQFSCDVVAGKKVLDVGIVEHHERAVASDRWLHRIIAQSAAISLGVDVLQEKSPL